MKTIHGPIYKEYVKGKAAQVQLKRRSDEELGSERHKQPRISAFGRGSTVMNLCVDLVVDSGRPFTIFKDKAMKSIINLARLQASENIEINSERVKNAVHAAAEKKRNEIGELLSKRVLSFSLNMAACRHRSFIGKTRFIERNVTDVS